MRDPVGRIRSTLTEGGIRLLLLKAARQIRTRVTILPASRALRQRIRAAASIEDCLDIAFEFRYDRLALAPQQNRSEIAGLLESVRHASPRVVLEIGTASGVTLMLFSCVAKDDATLITVDLPVGISRQRLHRAGAWSPRQTVRTVRGDSHKAKTKAIVEGLLRGRAVDFLFIDGDHSYEGVRADYEAFSPLVRSGGLIAFHDIVPGPEEYVGGVPDFWQEVKQGQGWREFVASWEQGGLGIGLIETRRMRRGAEVLRLSDPSPTA